MHIKIQLSWSCPLQFLPPPPPPPPPKPWASIIAQVTPWVKFCVRMPSFRPPGPWVWQAISHKGRYNHTTTGLIYIYRWMDECEEILELIHMGIHLCQRYIRICEPGNHQIIVIYTYFFGQWLTMVCFINHEIISNYSLS